MICSAEVEFTYTMSIEFIAIYIAHMIGYDEIRDGMNSKEFRELIKSC